MEGTKVFVVDSEGKPLLPTHPARARQLLREGKATVFQVVPFAIRLTHAVETPVGQFSIGIDDGAKEVGIAVVDQQTQEVVLTGVIELRQDVPRKVAQRKMYRRARRSRKTRYRVCRPHRKKGHGWLAPTIRQKKDSIVRVITDLGRVVNLTRAVIEQGQFDTSSLAAERKLAGLEYQIPNLTGRDFREKVLWRDGYKCHHCGGREHLQAHHIRFRSQGGSDTPHNGITLCESCHVALHNEEWVLNVQPKEFRYPAHLQVGKHYLVQQVSALGLTVDTCFGWMTRYWRQQLGLEKSHSNDAIVLTCRTYQPRMVGRHYRILPKRKKVWDNNPNKTCEEKYGFRHWDLVLATHRTRGKVVGSVRSLKAKVMTLRTAWDDNFPVAYNKTRFLWRFTTIIYI